MSRNSSLQPILDGLAAHPYLWTLIACLCCQPFLFGTDPEVTSYAQSAGIVAALCVTVVFGLYMFRSGNPTWTQLGIYLLSAATVGSFMARQYSRTEDETVAAFLIPWVIITAVVFLLMIGFARQGRGYTKANQTQINCLMIIGLGFLIKLLYVVISSVYTRQHDVYSFGGESGHAAYIEYILFNGALPDFDPRTIWQFYHPPLHHAISAAWIWFSQNVLLLGHNAARESLQTLTLFYSMCIVITSCRILQYFKLKGRALYIPLIVISFHPAFVLFSGSINNDVLSVAFIVGAVWCTLKWYENPTTKWIIKIALCIGLGMMTKVSAAIIAPSVALVFLLAFFRWVKANKNWKRMLMQFVCFCLVCVPLGTWFGIRNYIKWDVPFMYVQEMDPAASQYVGDLSFASRVTDFSADQFSSPFIRWESELYDIGVTEYNPIISLMKTSVFGESRLIDESSVLQGDYASIIPQMLFWTNAAIAGFALVAMVIVCLQRSTVQRTAAWFLASFYAVMMVSIYKMSADYPFTCTMNYRYITPTAVIGAVFIGMFLKETSWQKLGGKIAAFSLGAAVLLFAALTELIYMSVA